MSTPATRPPPQLVFDPNSLPISQLESLRFKANQIIESIQTLQRTIEAGNQNVMPPWPDILSKYNLILSQTHSFYSSLTSSLSASQPNSSSLTQARSPYEKIALHPSVGMTDAQFDNEIIPLLRTQQTTDVLKQENATVRRLAECMATRGALAISGVQSHSQSDHPVPGSGIARTQRVTNEDVLRECAEIREAHDHRTERAVRAVLMLRDKYDWKQRVAVEVEEPEDLQWDPRLSQPAMNATIGGGVEQDADIDADDGQSSDEEEVVEGELAGDDGETPSPHGDVEMGQADN
ncbi:hypothetical protein EDD17DRAFT_1463777 [Pisolithus thermaeus]|nr:hypothetical protein EDD17DRAFT_1463777 [Pisolithus thermaeus]